jgi:hypothetical protein
VIETLPLVADTLQMFLKRVVEGNQGLQREGILRGSSGGGGGREEIKVRHGLILVEVLHRERVEVFPGVGSGGRGLAAARSLSSSLQRGLLEMRRGRCRAQGAVVISSEFGHGALGPLFAGRHGSVGHLFLRKMTHFISVIPTPTPGTRRLPSLAGRDVVLGLQCDLHLWRLPERATRGLLLEGRDALLGATIVIGIEVTGWGEGGCGEKEGRWSLIGSLSLTVGPGDEREGGVCMRWLCGKGRSSFTAVLIRHDRHLRLLTEEGEVSGGLSGGRGLGLVVHWSSVSAATATGEKVLKSGEVLRIELAVGRRLDGSLAPTLRSFLHAVQSQQERGKVEVGQGDGGIGRKGGTHGSSGIEGLPRGQWDRLRKKIRRGWRWEGGGAEDLFLHLEDIVSHIDRQLCAVQGIFRSTESGVLVRAGRGEGAGRVSLVQGDISL